MPIGKRELHVRSPGRETLITPSFFAVLANSLPFPLSRAIRRDQDTDWGSESWPKRAILRGGDADRPDDVMTFAGEREKVMVSVIADLNAENALDDGEGRVSSPSTVVIVVSRCNCQPYINTLIPKRERETR